MHQGFRADIQGLRAVAVLVVIAFHAGLPLSGGFVGVDVFFVISGFVITAMLMREWDLTGSVSLATFYLRRAKRLTPALALVVAFTAVASSLFLSPFEQQVQASQTGLGALGLVANWVIAVQTGDYFGPSAESNPLLHTWSLSVEEQFYLVFPIVILAAWRLGRRLGRAHLAAVLVVSLMGLASLAMIRGSSLGISADSWVIGYYSPFNRAWEFAAGAFLALLAPVLPRNKPAATIAGVAGVALLVLVCDGDQRRDPVPGQVDPGASDRRHSLPRSGIPPPRQPDLTSTLSATSGKGRRLVLLAIPLALALRRGRPCHVPAVSMGAPDGCVPVLCPSAHVLQMGRDTHADVEHSTCQGHSSAG